ncbi:MAG: ubiquinone-binding protein [Rhodospirillaceae bacterium]|nr:ubiquinone-binding protein [Rhodospirillaceae bacterium]
MYRHSERRYLAHSPNSVFKIVLDVETYPEFLPWCVAVRILEQNEASMIAEMAVGYKGIRETYTSEINFIEEDLKIEVGAVDGPFSALLNTWHFTEAQDGGCVVDFSIEFEFRSRLLQGVIGVFFEQAVARMVAAFEQRADSIHYGKA